MTVAVYGGVCAVAPGSEAPALLERPLAQGSGGETLDQVNDRAAAVASCTGRRIAAVRR